MLLLRSARTEAISYPYIGLSERTFITIVRVQPFRNWVLALMKHLVIHTMLCIVYPNRPSPSSNFFEIFRKFVYPAENSLARLDYWKEKDVKILVAYHSIGGNTQKVAQAVAEGAGDVGSVEVTLK